MRYLTKKIALYINYLFVVLLTVAYIGPYIDPSIFWPTAFLGIVFPYLVIINFLFVLFWGLVKSNYIFIPIIFLLIGFGYGSSMIQFNLSSSTPDQDSASFKLLSYNVRLFDLYEWRKGKETKDDIMDLIQEEKADIVCLQEFFHSDQEGYYPTLKNIDSFKKSKYSHLKYIELEKKNNHNWGIATFSNFPIVSKGQVPFDNPGNDLCIYSDILIHTDTIRVYNIHLASVGLKKEDYELLEKLNETDKDVQIKGLTSINMRVKDAFIRRADQANTIKEHMSGCTYKTVLCGDFNDTPFSYVFQVLSGDMKDAFEEGGQLMGPTYIAKFPSLRIDYILHSEGIQSKNYKRINKELSDHYPITTQLTFN